VRNNLGLGGNLYFYHKYEQNHTEALNTHVPLHQHYSNEKHNREALDHINDEITDSKRHTGFKVRTLKREVLGLKNEENKMKSTLKAEKRIADQRIRGVKEEINHQEKFRELYDGREETNRAHAGTALPDQAPSYNELVKFDHSRAQSFENGEHSQQDQLVSTESKEMQANMEGQKQEAMIDAKIDALKAELSNVERSSEFKEKLLEHKAHHLENVIQEDEALDAHRRQNEEIESHATLASQIGKKNKQKVPKH
jgi:hypothetical protein